MPGVNYIGARLPNCRRAHRISAHYYGIEVKRTKRYKMGRRVGNHARNLLLMTATPHNGKE